MTRTLRIALVVTAFLITILDLFGLADFTRAPYHGIRHNNLVFLEFEKESPNAEKDLVAGDRVVAVNGIRPRNIIHFKYLTRSNTPFSSQVFTIVRADSMFDLEIDTIDQPGNKTSRKIALSLTALIFMVVGSYVIYKRQDVLGRLYAFNCLLFAFLLTQRPSTSINLLHVIGEVFYDGVFAFLPAVFLHLFLIFPGKEIHAGTKRSTIERSLYVAPVLIFLSMFVLALVNYSMELPSFILLGFNGIASVYWLVYMTGGVSLFIRTYMTSDKVQRVKFRIATIGLIAGTAPATFVMLIRQFAPSLDIPFDTFSMVFLSLMPISFAYAILRHDAFDMRVVFKTGLAYVLVPAVLGSMIYLFARDIFERFPGLPDGKQLSMLTIVLMLAVIAFVMARAGIIHFVDWVFFRNRRKFRERMIEFSRRIQFLSSQEEIADFTAKEIYEMFTPEYVHIFTFEKDTDTYVRRKSRPEKTVLPLTSLPSSMKLIRIARVGRQPVMVECFDSLWTMNNLDRISLELISMVHISVVIPMVEQNEMPGLIIIGRKKSGKPFDGADAEMLEILGERSAAAIRSNVLFNVSKEKEKLEKEVHLASKIQQRLLPEAPPLLKHSTIKGRLRNCREVGGDFYDFVEFDNGKIGVAVADVSGKGIPASLLMTTLQASFRAEATEDRSPGEVLSALNKSLYIRSEVSKFATFFYAVYDDCNGLLHYCNGGSFPPLLIRSDGTVIQLKRGGILVGVDPESVYQEGMIKLRKNDILAIYTDGIIDQENSREEYFGETRLAGFLQEHSSVDADEMIESLYDNLMSFGEGLYKDDMTIVILKRNEKSKEVSDDFREEFASSGNSDT
ncbi:MAG: SpoIIE family protein phosphatase [Candidatus Krumholzibacteria bacterium]|nr:SpoIIE family protein phosphatase [Candidatus Krumholzibacteria bacterium]